MAFSIFDYIPAHNYSLHAIPAYMVLTTVPTLYAVRLIQSHSVESGSASSDAKTSKKESRKKESSSSSSSSSLNASGLPPLPTAGNLNVKLFGPVFRADLPRSSSYKATLAQRLPPAAFHAYERAIAAHQNCMENLPLFFTAILLANYPRVGYGVANGAWGVKLVNAFAGTLLLSRVVYIWSYISAGAASSNRWAIRNICYNIGLVSSLASIIVVAERFRKGGRA